MPYFLLFCCVIPTLLTFFVSETNFLLGFSDPEKVWYDVLYDHLWEWNMYFNYGFSGDLV